MIRFQCEAQRRLAITVFLEEGSFVRYSVDRTHVCIWSVSRCRYMIVHFNDLSLPKLQAAFLFLSFFFPFLFRAGNSYSVPPQKTVRIRMKSNLGEKAIA